MLQVKPTGNSLATVCSSKATLCANQTILIETIRGADEAGLSTENDAAQEVVDG